MKTLRSLFPTGLAMLAFCFLVSSAQGWGGAGHRIVAKLAEERLNAKAKAQIKALLGNTNLDSIANWADQIKFTTMKQSYNWHFVDMEKDEKTYNSAMDCK